MQFDAIGRNARLSVQEIEEANTGHRHRDIGRLERASWRVASIKLSARMLNAGQ